LVQKMREGKLVGDTSILGRIGDVAHSRLATELTQKGGATKAKPKTKKNDDDDGGNANGDDGGGASASLGEKRARAPRKPRAKAEKADNGVDSDATDEYEVVVEAVSAKPKCPYGADCFRTNPEHFQQYTHDGGATTATTGAPSSSVAATTMKPVIKRKKS
jgi:hypothetical protein